MRFTKQQLVDARAEGFLEGRFSEKHKRRWWVFWLGIVVGYAGTVGYQRHREYIKVEVSRGFRWVETNLASEQK
jgi:hypothetical protein